MSEFNTIITIGRQFGSAGREIGNVIAKDYGIKLYDKEMLKRAAKESGICEELFETHDEKPTNSFLYSLVMDTYSLGYVFIYADLDIRVRRIARLYNLTDAKAKDMILKTDKKRASYYNYYTNKEWAEAKSYDLCLNSGKLGVEGTAKAIKDYVSLRNNITDAKL